MIKLKFKLKTADEEDDENHTCNYSLCLTCSNPTKVFEKGLQINFIKGWYNDLHPLIFGLNLHVDKKKTYERHFCFIFASQSVLSCILTSFTVDG